MDFKGIGDEYMIKITDLPLSDRPREKLIAKGAENLSDKELLAILLRTGTAGKSALDIADNILKKFPIKRLLSMKLSDLKDIKGIDKGKTTSLLAAFELSRRALDKFDSNLPIIKSPRVAVDQLSDLRNLKKENFVVLYLNTRLQLICRETISVGILNASLVHPREVFEPAIRNLASSVMVAHNHPSGDNNPSEEDILLTEKLVKSGKILDIHVLDHIIITKDNYFSFKEKGMI